MLPVLIAEFNLEFDSTPTCTKLSSIETYLLSITQLNSALLSLGFFEKWTTIDLRALIWKRHLLEWSIQVANRRCAAARDVICQGRTATIITHNIPNCYCMFLTFSKSIRVQETCWSLTIFTCFRFIYRYNQEQYLFSWNFADVHNLIT